MANFWQICGRKVVNFWQICGRKVAELWRFSGKFVAEKWQKSQGKYVKVRGEFLASSGRNLQQLSGKISGNFLPKNYFLKTFSPKIKFPPKAQRVQGFTQKFCPIAAHDFVAVRFGADRTCSLARKKLASHFAKKLK